MNKKDERNRGDHPRPSKREGGKGVRSRRGATNDDGADVYRSRRRRLSSHVVVHSPPKADYYPSNVTVFPETSVKVVVALSDSALGGAPFPSTSARVTASRTGPGS